ncbi:MAG: hypothetical protein H6819_06070 [Phycisphaerales bacterium]|nr:hypothetical protein [Phycisphaerales bacterium]MCB9858612.1 hypothetical protein [Phycisphaerales bacterium]
MISIMATPLLDHPAFSAPRRGEQKVIEPTADASGVRLIEREYISVRYSGLPTDYAEAIANVANATFDFYRSAYRFDMPDRLFIEADLAEDNPTSIWIADDHTIQLRYGSERDLAPPNRSRVDTIYGLTYRMADLGRERTLGEAPWLTDSAARGLSHLLACRMIDRLHVLYGRTLWPQAYDYVESGWPELRDKLDHRNEPDAIRASAVWHALESEFESGAIGDTLATWRRAAISGGRPADALLAALAGRTVDSHKRSKLRRWFREFEPLCVWTDGKRAKFERSFNTGQLARNAQLLRYDDDKSDREQVAATGGHITTFQTPPDQWYLKELRFHGEQFGALPRNGKDFVISIYDEKFKIVASWRKPFGLLRGSGPQWHRVRLPVTRLPEKFVVLIDFGSTKNVGVRLSADTSTKGHSASGDLRRGVTPLTDADWMIQVEIDRKKDDNPLKYRPD